MLSPIDGVSHLNWTQNLGSCFSSYHGLSCVVGFPFSFDPNVYWFFWFLIIFIAMPLFLYWVTREKFVVPGYFLLTGIPWVFDGIGFYSQFFLCFFLVFLVYSKDWKKRVGVSVFLLVLTQLRLIIHAQQRELALCALGIEVLMFVLVKIDFKKYFLGVFGLPIEYLRSIGYNGQVNGQFFIPAMFYYGYHLLVRPMLFVFSIPALLHIVVQKDWRKLLWLLVLFGAAIYMWFYESFSNTTILRVFVMFGFILMPSFLEWLKKQDERVIEIYFVLAVGWGAFQLVSWGLYKLG